MQKIQSILLLIFVFTLLSLPVHPHTAFAQDKKKGDLEGFTDDYGDDESEDNGDSDDSTEFFLWLFFDNIGDFVNLWGGTPGTQFGPYPSYPYAAGNGFGVNSDEYRSFFFNTEFNYHYLNDHLQSYLFKWESQFLRNSKLSFDLAVYEETIAENNFSYQSKDYLALWGARYGYAVVRTPQLILNVEGGFRSLIRNRVHGGPEIALDVQIFPKRPFIFETKLAAAYVSNAPLYTFESSMGIAVGRFEILGGLRVLKNKSEDLLDGFKIGLRVWY